VRCTGSRVNLVLVELLCTSFPYLVLGLGDEPLASVVVGLSISATLVLDLVA
jgi:hypothetical protein